MGAAHNPQLKVVGGASQLITRNFLVIYAVIWLSSTTATITLSILAYGAYGTGDRRRRWALGLERSPGPGSRKLLLELLFTVNIEGKERFRDICCLYCCLFSGIIMSR